MPLISKRKKTREEIEFEIQSRNSINLGLFCILVAIIIFSALLEPWLHKMRAEKDHEVFNYYYHKNTSNKTVPMN